MVDDTPAPRVALVAHGGEGLDALGSASTLCLGAEREGLSADVLERCDTAVTIPLRAGGAESLNVAAAAAIACEWISSRAMREASGQMLERIERSRSEAEAAIAGARAAPPSSRSCGSATWAANPS